MLKCHIFSVKLVCSIEFTNPRLLQARVFPLSFPKHAVLLGVLTVLERELDQSWCSRWCARYWSSPRGSRGLPMWLLAGSPKFSKINKNIKMFTKWVAVARKSLLTTAFYIIFEIRLMVTFSVKNQNVQKSKIDKNTKMFTKWVAVARKSLLIIAFCVIFRAPPHGDVRFGQNP